MALTDDIISAVNARVDARWEQLQRAQTNAIGVVTDVKGWNDAYVTFDGSAMSIPVKLSGESIAIPGDRVALARFGRWWVVVATLNRRWPSLANVQTQQSTGGSTVSSTYTDVPNPADITLVKRWDDTRIYVQVSAGSYCSAIPCEAHFGAQLTDSAGNVTTNLVTNAPYSAAAFRTSVTDAITIAGMAADTYTARVVWRRQSGTGTVQTDVSEFISLTVAEVSP